jgi:hypothetical protein
MSSFCMSVLDLIKSLCKVKLINTSVFNKVPVSIYQIGPFFFVKVRFHNGMLTVEAYCTKQKIIATEYYTVFLPPPVVYSLVRYPECRARSQKCTQHIDKYSYDGIKWIIYTESPLEFVTDIISWILENFNVGRSTTVQACKSRTRAAGEACNKRLNARISAMRDDAAAAAGEGAAGDGLTHNERRVQISNLLNP